MIRGLSIAAGLGCVAIGVLGVVLPGLPASPLFIASVWFFSRSSPRLERWVLGLPGVGQLVADHRSGLGVPARVKVVAIAMMAVAVGASATFALHSWPLRLGVIGLGVIGGSYLVFGLPTKPASRT